ncbi:unnamed protein product [Ambrosiozyma monospora]|uniref:Unnamed protein product n=1 Tax=Ambrosiozyma monospora TaxID=43982 RepID=A0ACB5TBD2_AMBMO|nr:unnamed protein product [Ambrosiozyma monospora]
MTATKTQQPEVRHCCAPNCGKVTTSSLKCPICLKQGINSYFCNSRCFRSSFAMHKAIHKKEGAESYDPFPEFPYAGELRPAYPLTPRKEVPAKVKLPDYAQTGEPISEIKNDRTNKIRVLTADEIKKMRIVCELGREVLDAGAAAVKPGVTTEEIDKIIHEETIKRKAYPSPLNYFNYPKSVCTSVNEVICHERFPC